MASARSGAREVSGTKEGAHAEPLHRLAEQLVGGGAMGDSRQVLQAVQCFAECSVFEEARVGPEIEGLRGAGALVQRLDGIGNLLLGETDERAAQQRAEGDGVAWIGDGPHNCYQIVDFLTVVEALSGLRRDGNAALCERVLVHPQIGAGRGEQRDVARAGRALPSERAIPDWVVADEAAQRLGDGGGFGAAKVIGAGSGSVRTLPVVERDVDGGNGRSRAGLARRGERGEARLPDGLDEQGRKRVVHDAEDARAAAEVRAHLDDAIRIASDEGAFGRLISVEVGAAEAVDRLFRIADEEEGSGPDGARVPGRARVTLAGQAPHYVGLYGVGVLELVNEEVRVASRECAAYRLVVAEQFTGAVEELVEVEEA